jgi:pilus assembly protein Flp/PilA
VSLFDWPLNLIIDSEHPIIYRNMESGVLYMSNAIKTFLNNEDGATMIEYGLLAALIGVAAITALGTLSTALNTIFTDIATKLKI